MVFKSNAQRRGFFGSRKGNVRVRRGRIAGYLGNEQRFYDNLKKVVRKPIATIKDRDKISKRIFGTNFKNLSLRDTPIINSELELKGYKLNAYEPTQKKIDDELKEMHKVLTKTFGKPYADDRIEVERKMKEWEKKNAKKYSV